jgi:hypothetical protein
MDADREKFVRLIHIRFGEHRISLPETLEAVSSEENSRSTQGAHR